MTEPPYIKAANDAIRQKDAPQLVDVLNYAAKTNVISDIDLIHLGIALTYPDPHDPPRAMEIFEKAAGTLPALASIWGICTYVAYAPDSDFFVRYLSPDHDDSTFLYCMALYHRYMGDNDTALSCVDKSLLLAEYPSNLLLKVDVDQRADRDALLAKASSMVVIGEDPFGGAYNLEEFGRMNVKMSVTMEYMSSLQFEHVFRQ